MLTFDQLASCTGGKVLKNSSEQTIHTLLTDSRKARHADSAVFFAMKGMAHDGHQYLSDVYKLGCRNFVVERENIDLPGQNINLLCVERSLDALQNVASFHRQQYHGKVVGITGSNGKTIVKEWLYELLDPRFAIVKSPLSYNSQLGVPLSVWEIQPGHDYAIIEAGISQMGEMQKLQEIIRPDIGIITNIGAAHQEGFESIEQKLDEKLRLFRECRLLIYCSDQKQVQQGIERMENKPGLLSWGEDPSSACRIVSRKQSEGVSEIDMVYLGQSLRLKFPFISKVDLENAMHCVALLLHEGYNEAQIQAGLSTLRGVSMRLRVLKGRNESILLDDSYNNDLTGFEAALQQLLVQPGEKNAVVILSDMLQTGMEDSKLYTRISEIITRNMISHFVGIGPAISSYQKIFPKGSRFYPGTSEFIREFPREAISKCKVLIKGARSFEMERIVSSLQKRVHGTVLEINLNQVSRNLNYYRSKLRPDVRIMAMVKALAYGSGSIQMVRHLYLHGVDQFAVAYADEGISLRENGITAPVMVMNPEPDVLEQIIDHNLEPEIYSISQLRRIIDLLEDRELSIHIKLETGMHRLGMNDEDIRIAGQLLRDHPGITVKSLFSHLVASEDPVQDTYTHQQASRLYAMVQELRRYLHGQEPMIHLLNSGGISRFPMYQFDMVRIGIGLYGHSPNSEDKPFLHPAQTFKSYISQIKTVNAGETVGYGRAGKVGRKMKIATVAVGYADGYSRKFSNDAGYMTVRGKRAHVIGNVCMDMTMLDVTGIDAEEGDEVIIFGSDPGLEDLARKLGTIPYEILAGINDRVRRVYTFE